MGTPPAWHKPSPGDRMGGRGRGVRPVTLRAWRVPSPKRQGGTRCWGWGRGHETQGTQEMGDRTECWGQGRGTRSLGAPRHGVSGTGCCWGQGTEMGDLGTLRTGYISSPWGTGWVGVLRIWGCCVGTAPAAGPGAHLGLAYPEVGRGPCLILLDIPLHAWREPDPSPSGTFPTHQTPRSQCPQHTLPFPRGRGGDPRGWVARRWGRGHSLFSLLRTLLAIFLISAVSCSRSSLVSAESRHVSRGSHRGERPRGRGTRDPGKGGREGGHGTHSAQGWGPRG